MTHHITSFPNSFFIESYEADNEKQVWFALHVQGGSSYACISNETAQKVIDALTEVIKSNQKEVTQ